VSLFTKETPVPGRTISVWGAKPALVKWTVVTMDAGVIVAVILTGATVVVTAAVVTFAAGAVTFATIVSVMFGAMVATVVAAVVTSVTGAVVTVVVCAEGDAV